MDHVSSYLQPPSTEAEIPFTIVLRKRDRTPGGSFVPYATVEITPALATTGLIRDVPPEELRTLLLLLTFVTPNGLCQPTTEQIAAALGISERAARRRLERLRDYRWRGQPLAAEATRESGLSSFSPLAGVVAVRQAEPDVPSETAMPFRAAGRDAVIARSRAMYTKPRAEVERIVMEQLGHTTEVADTNPGPNAQTRRKLLGLGVLREQADLLLMNYPLERIERQIGWLPYRHAKNPARLLIASIEHDYEPPPHALRLGQIIVTAPPLTRNEKEEPTTEQSPVNTANLEGTGQDGNISDMPLYATPE
jgi:hypothetical protein